MGTLVGDGRKKKRASKYIDQLGLDLLVLLLDLEKKSFVYM